MRIPFVVFSVLGLLVSSCATPRPQTLDSSSGQAVLYATPVNCVAVGACVSRIKIRTINGSSTQNISTQYNFKVEAGPVSVLVVFPPVLGEKIRSDGVCELEFVAEAGRTYILDRETIAGVEK